MRSRSTTLPTRRRPTRWCARFAPPAARPSQCRPTWRDEEQVLAMFEQVDAQLGRLTALVNNAGVVDVTARVDEMSVARLKRMFDINVIGSFVCAREAVRRMSTRHGGGGGAIVNVSSAASRLGSPGQYVDYAAAKGAIDAFTHRAGQGSRGRRHPRQRGAAGTDRNRHPRLRRHPGPRAAAGASGADAAGRHGAGGGRDHRLAAVAAGQLHHHVADRSFTAAG